MKKGQPHINLAKQLIAGYNPLVKVGFLTILVSFILTSIKVFIELYSGEVTLPLASVEVGLGLSVAVVVYAGVIVMSRVFPIPDEDEDEKSEE